VYLVADYWIDKGRLNYTTGSALQSLPLQDLDVSSTRELNAERGVNFLLTGKSR
jgi:hypothetical protein